jgi:Protein of unknown function (DUF2585)
LITSRVITKLSAPNKRNFWPWIVIVCALAATALQLHNQGRLWWCSCRGFLWTGNAWGSLTSQTFLDPYSFTHILHGLMFCGLLTLVVRRLPISWRLCMAIIMEASWELIENTNTVIERYRAATAFLGYQGDTVINSLGDITCCGIGFMIARKLGWRCSLVLFITTEAVLLIWIRDSLLLEILMLVNPINAIKVWQAGH